MDDLKWLLDAASDHDGDLVLTFPGTCLSDDTSLADTRAHLNRLSDAGACIWLDNPGLDVSWVLNLDETDIRGICLSPSLVAEVDGDRASRALVFAATGLATSLGLEVAARDIRRDEQVAQLQKLGCRVVSGAVVADPMGLDQAIEWAKGLALSSGAGPDLGVDLTA